MGLFDAFRRQPTGGPSGVRARLEGAMSRRRLRGWQPPLENINSLVASGGPRLLARSRELMDLGWRAVDIDPERLLARSRELVVTNGYAANACEAYAANLVGDGIKPSSLIEDGELRDKIQRLWLAWTDQADADGLTDFDGLQAMIARENAPGPTIFQTGVSPGPFGSSAMALGGPHTRNIIAENIRTGLLFFIFFNRSWRSLKTSRFLPFEWL